MLGDFDLRLGGSAVEQHAAHGFDCEGGAAGQSIDVVQGQHEQLEVGEYLEIADGYKTIPKQLR